MAEMPSKIIAERLDETDYSPIAFQNLFVS